jgi:hypothetical protein
MGQDLVVIDHKVLSETSARLLAPRQVEKLNGAASVSQSIAAKLMQKDRDYSPLSHNNPKLTYTLGSRKCISGELNFSSMPHCLHHGMSSDMMVVPPQAEYGELMSRQDTKAVEVSLQFSTLPLFPNLSTVLAECRGITRGGTFVAVELQTW